MNTQSLARGLAFFSVGLGMAELLAPRQVAKAIGVSLNNDRLLRFLGVRELGAGLGMMQGNPALFTWSRVAGDAMDLGLLATALRSRSANRNRVIGAIAAVAGVTAVDILAGVLLSRNPTQPDWRVAHEDRRGISGDNPRTMQPEAEATMAGHDSGHIEEYRRAKPVALEYEPVETGTAEREDRATQEFEPGD